MSSRLNRPGPHTQTDWGSLISVPPLNIKNYPPDGWNIWFTQFQLHTRVIEFSKLSDQEKVAVLLLKLGGDVTPIFHTFNVRLDEVSYQELVELFDTYFTPANMRNVFLSTKQKSGESFVQFAERLTMLSYPCRFGPFHDGILRDVFLLNVHNMYVGIRDNILKHHRDPSFEEVLRLSNELLLETCHVTRSNRLENSVSTPPVPSVTRDFNNVRASPRNMVKRKELDTKSESDSEEMFEQNFKHAQQPNKRSEQRRQSNSPPAIENDSHKLSTAIKHALDNNSVSSKPSPFLSSNEIPKIDFAFKCFSVSDAANNNPCGEKPKPASFSRFSTSSNNKNSRTSHIENEYSDVQPLNLSSNKPLGVNARLIKFGNKSRDGVATTRSSISPGKVDISVPFMSRNSLPDCDRSSPKGWCNSNENKVSDKCPVSQIHSSHEKRTVPSQNKANELSFTSNHGGDASRDPIRASLSNSDSNAFDPPVSKNIFSEVVIVYISEIDDTMYVCPIVKCQFLDTIETKLSELNEQNVLLPIKNIAVGEKYAAPFKGDWYRAEIISANIKKKTVQIAFCDYGNEEYIPMSDLRLLPEEFQELEPLSFPIKLPVGAPEVKCGSRLKIRPLTLNADCWEVELRSNQR